jgi:hypothetical protein
MNRKIYLVLTSAFLSSVILMGCNANDDRDDVNRRNMNTPVNYENDMNDVDLNNDDVYRDNDARNLRNDVRNDVRDNDMNAPGVDEDDNLLRDDENDNDPDPEDIIEDPRDMTDKDKRDE